MIPRLFVKLLVPCGLLALAACGSGGSPPGGVCRSLEQACTRTADCCASLTCGLYGTCVFPPAGSGGTGGTTSNGGTGTGGATTGGIGTGGSDGGSCVGYGQSCSQSACCSRLACDASTNRCLAGQGQTCGNGTQCANGSCLVGVCVPGGGSADGGVPVGPTSSIPFDPVCGNGGFCWVNPLPQGNDLDAVFSAAPGDVWMAGHAGTLLHYDGTRVSPVSLASPADIITGLAGTATTDVWAVTSRSGLYHYDGASWTSSQAIAGNGIWAASPTLAWVVTPTAVYQWDGTIWAGVNLPSPASSWQLGCISGVDANDVWVGGNTGSGGSGLLHWDGTAWGIVPASGISDAVQIAAFSHTDAWALDAQNGLFHWDGQTWTVPHGLPLPSSAQVTAVGGTDSNHEWAFVDDGSSTVDGAPTGLWYSLSSGGGTPMGAEEFPDVSAIGGAAGDGWAVGAAGLIFHLENGQFARVGSGSLAGLDGAWGVGPDTWFAGSGEVLDVNAGIVTPLPSAPVEPFSPVTGSGPTDLWVANAHFDGTAWTSYDISTVTGLLEWSPTNVWAAAGEASIAHWGGSTWSTVSSGEFGCLAGSSPDDIWAGGVNTVAHWDGTFWTASSLGMVANAAWDLAGDVWLAGGNNGGPGIVAHLNANGNWDITDLSGAVGALTAITSRGPADVWAVGGAGTLWNYDGTQWQTVMSGTDQDLQAAWADTTHVWIAGNGGAVLLHP
ncbi:MAG: hypothetical protein ACYDCL_06495 [Myxococcales bacterium]